MRFFLSLFLFLCTIFCKAETPVEVAAKDLAIQIVENLKTKSEVKLAVVDFSYFEEKSTALDRFLTDSLVTELFLIPDHSFLMVERHLVKKLIREAKVQAQAAFESTTEVGKLLGADVVVTGTISEIGDQYVVNAKLLDVETASLFAVAKSRIAKTESVTKLYQTILSVRDRVVPPGKTATKFAQEVGEVTFELGEITYDAKGLRINYKMVSKVDQQVTLSGGTFYDDKGNTIKNPYVYLGNQSGRNSVQNYFVVAGIETSGYIVFSRALAKPSYIPLYKLKLKAGGRDFELEFRDIPVP